MGWLPWTNVGRKNNSPRACPFQFWECQMQAVFRWIHQSSKIGVHCFWPWWWWFHRLDRAWAIKKLLINIWYNSRYEDHRIATQFSTFLSIHPRRADARQRWSQRNDESFQNFWWRRRRSYRAERDDYCFPETRVNWTNENGSEFQDKQGHYQQNFQWRDEPEWSYSDPNLLYWLINDHSARFYADKHHKLL